MEKETCLEPLVLKYFLDSNITDGVRVFEELRLEDDTKGAVADDFAVGVDKITGVARLAIGGDNLDDLARIVDGCERKGTEKGEG